MADRPNANVGLSEQAGGFAGGSTGYLAIFAAVATNADATPRVFASRKAALDQHGYAQGVDYGGLHVQKTRKPFIMVGLPIVTAGTIGRQNNTGVTGTCAITVAAAASGVLEETDSSLTVVVGGTIGTNGIQFDYSADGGRTNKRVRLVTASSYTVPYLGIVLNFAAGTLIAGDVYTFSTTAPKWDQAGLQAAREALAAQKKPVRSILVVGDLENATEAGYVTTEVNAYETENQRFTYARANVRDRIPLATKSKIRKAMTGSPTLTFAEVGGTGDTITRSAGSWITDGFAVGDVVTVGGSVSNNVTGPIASLSATVLTFGTTDLAAEGPVGGCTVVGSEGLTFAEVGGTGDTVTRSTGSWLADGFRVGDVVTFSGTASNNVSGAIAALTATVLTFGTTDLAAEVIGSHNVDCVKGETMSAWISLMDSTFAAVDAQKRIDLGAGRARKLSPITGWEFRRPAAWAASIREYEHDVHIPCWRKEDGPLDGWSMEDTNGKVVEYDERSDGGALAARFTCFTTWSNGPEGAFISLSLTRDTEGAMLSRTHNLAVANVVCGVVQSQSEYGIGRVLQLNKDGTGSEDAISKFETGVNGALKSTVLEGGSEGPRASFVLWKASRNDNLNVVPAKLHGTAVLELNGTLEEIDTEVIVQTAGG